MSDVPLLNLVNILAADVDAGVLKSLLVLGFGNQRLLVVAAHLGVLNRQTW